MSGGLTYHHLLPFVYAFGSLHLHVEQASIFEASITFFDFTNDLLIKKKDKFKSIV